MTQPKLSLAGSGYGGRGYRDIFGSGEVLPSVTTCLGIVGDPAGLIYWNVEQTALYAVTHIDDLLNRTEEAGVRYLQYVTKKQKAEVLDDPNLNVYNAHRVILDDYSNTGDFIHRYIEDDLLDKFPEEPVREDHVEMVEAWHEWRKDHDLEVIATEFTVFGDGYAGTGDWIMKVDGVLTLGDNKSSRKIGQSHIAQLAAIGAAHTMAVEVSENEPGAVYHKLQPKVSAEHGGQVDSWWVPESLPNFQEYGILTIRPSDWDKQGTYIEPFVKFTKIPQKKIDAGYKFFRAGLAARLAEREMKEAGDG